MKPRTPETLIARLRNRRARIALLTFASIAFVLVTVLHGWMVYTMLQSRVPHEGDDLLSTVLMNEAMTPMLIAGIFKSYLFLMLSVLMICGLVAELTSFTKGHLLVEMWDRIQSLERRIAVADRSGYTGNL